MARETAGPFVEREQAAQRADPQRAVALVQKRVAAVVDGARVADGEVLRPARRDIQVIQAAHVGADVEAAAVVGQDALDVVGEAARRSRGHVVVVVAGEVPRRRVVAEDAVVVRADPQHRFPGVGDDATHRAVYRPRSVRCRVLRLQHLEPVRQRVVVVHAAVVGAEPDALLVVDADRPYGVVADRRGVRGVDMTADGAAFLIEDRQSVVGSHPETPVLVALQDADVVRSQPGGAALGVAGCLPQRFVDAVETVSVGRDPVSSVGRPHDGRDVAAAHLGQNPMNALLLSLVAVEPRRRSDENLPAAGPEAEGADVDARQQVVARGFGVCGVEEVDA